MAEAGIVHAFSASGRATHMSFIRWSREPNCMWTAGVIMGFVLAGCAGFDMEEPAGLSGSPAFRSEDDGAKNLAAIRAMIIQERQRTSSTPGSREKPASEGMSASWPPDWLSQYFPSARSGEREFTLPSSSIAPRSVSPARGRTVHGNVTATIPWVPQAPNAGSSAESWPPVAPYIHAASPAPVYPGTIRCVPDMFGGQRCHAD